MSGMLGARAARLAPLARSVSLTVSFRPGWLWWGATWSYCCGLAAGLPAELATATLIRAMAGWMVAVPLYGAFWSTLLQRGEDRPYGVPTAAAMLAAALVLAAAVAPPVAVTLLLASLVLGADWVSRGGPPDPTGAVRSVQEVLVPALVGWLAIGGPVGAPAALAATEGVAWTAGTWMVDNGPVVLVFAAFALVHHGATTALRRRELSRRWGEIVAGHVAAALILAAGGHALAAAAVALLFVVAWPFQSALRTGRVVWHLRHAQWFAMAAMLAAALGV